MLKSIGAALAALLFAVPAVAQQQFPPSGQPVLNQARSAVALTPNDSTTFIPTRGLHIAGNSTGGPCNISAVFSDNTVAVTVVNLNPGQPVPYSIKQLRATGTTCVSTLAFY